LFFLSTGILSRGKERGGVFGVGGGGVGGEGFGFGVSFFLGFEPDYFFLRLYKIPKKSLHNNQKYRSRNKDYRFFFFFFD
jgi:hypothetical protein